MSLEHLFVEKLQPHMHPELKACAGLPSFNTLKLWLLFMHQKLLFAQAYFSHHVTNLLLFPGFIFSRCKLASNAFLRQWESHTVKRLVTVVKAMSVAPHSFGFVRKETVFFYFMPFLPHVFENGRVVCCSFGLLFKSIENRAKMSIHVRNEAMNWLFTRK